MEDNELKQMINNYIKEICHFSQMQVFATSYYQKNYFQQQIDEKVSSLVASVKQLTIDNVKNMTLHTEQQAQGTVAFSPEELAYYDGSQGRAAYVAVNGIIYDMTMLPGWAGGTHFGQYAGKDLTEVFMDCHQGTLSFLDNIPKVGILIQ